MKNVENIAVRGAFRLQITEDNKIVGDSGWHKNLITNLGFNQYIIQSIGTGLTGKVISHVALGTGGAPVATDTALAGEADVSKRAAVTAATSSSSKTLRLTATFNSSASFVSDTINISNIGLFNTSAQTTGTMFAGNTYASSAVATNQNVNITYDVVFATS
jgi:hypothetical protein